MKNEGSVFRQIAIPFGDNYTESEQDSGEILAES